MKKLLESIVLLIIVLISSGCLGTVSPDQCGYVVMIGVDKGVQKDYVVSFMLQDDTNTEASQSGKEGALIASAEADTIFEAVTVMDYCLPFQMNLSRTNLIIFSDEIAKDGKIEEFLDFSWNSLRIRQSIKMAVAIGGAQEFMWGLKSESTPNITKLQYNFLRSYSGEGVTSAINYALFMQGVRSATFDPALTLGRVDESVENAEQMDREQPDYRTSGIDRTGGMISYTSGTAIFDRWRMVGVLNERDTLLLMIVNSELNNGHIRIDDGKEAMIIMLKKTKRPRIDFALDDGNGPHADVHIKLRCEIQQDVSDTAKLRWDNEIKEMVESRIEDELTRVFKQCQKLGSDAMGMGKCASKLFYSTDEWEKYDWKSHYGSMSVDFIVDVTMNDENIMEYME